MPAAPEAGKWPGGSRGAEVAGMFMIQEPKVQHLHEKLLDHENRMLERILADAVGAGGTSGEHGTLQPRILYRPPASLLWLIVQRHRKCVASGGVRSASAAVLGRLVELWLCRPGRSRAGDTEKPKSFEKKAPRVSSRPRSRRDHLRGERDWRGRVRQCCARQRLPP